MPRAHSPPAVPTEAWPGAFPPVLGSFRARGAEMNMLERAIRERHPTVLALVGAGGSGKSTLAAALGQRLAQFFGGRLLWVRMGGWSAGTVLELMGHQLRVAGESRIRRVLGAAPTLVVLDNHEDDRATAELLRRFESSPVTWIITARRCLLGGVTIVPVAPPLIGEGESPFPRVAKLTRILRWHPVALSLADALVMRRHTTVAALGRSLLRRRIDRIVPIEHEDDLPEVGAMVAESTAHASAAGIRMLAVLASSGGDHMDRTALHALARARRSAPSALDTLVAMRIVDEPLPGRYALHATVRHALRKRLSLDEDAIAAYYLSRFERGDASRALDVTHLFALMDWAQAKSDVGLILRVRALTTSS